MKKTICLIIAVLAVIIVFLCILFSSRKHNDPIDTVIQTAGVFPDPAGSPFLSPEQTHNVNNDAADSGKPDSENPSGNHSITISEKDSSKDANDTTTSASAKNSDTSQNSTSVKMPQTGNQTDPERTETALTQSEDAQLNNSVDETIQDNTPQTSEIILSEQAEISQQAADVQQGIVQQTDSILTPSEKTPGTTSEEAIPEGGSQIEVMENSPTPVKSDWTEPKL